jgi:PAS domain S-box-containing protein
MGWATLFWAVFKRSQNPMALLNDERCLVEVNGAMLRAVGYRRDALVGAPAWRIVKDGPALTEGEWHALLRGGGDFFGKTDLVAADGATISVQFAAHPEVVTGRRLVLFVTLETARHGRFQKKPQVSNAGPGALTAREREVVHLVALGDTAREIADKLHVTHNTVRTHIRNAQAKLGARSQAQLVAMALGGGHTPSAPS